MPGKVAKDLLEAMNEVVEIAKASPEEREKGWRVHHVDVGTPDVAAMRAKLKLSQDEFARAFGVSLGTVRNWEQGRRQPEGAARVLLKVIDVDPIPVLRAIHGARHAPAAAPGRSSTPRSSSKRRA